MGRKDRVVFSNPKYRCQYTSQTVTKQAQKLTEDVGIELVEVVFGTVVTSCEQIRTVTRRKPLRGPHLFSSMVPGAKYPALEEQREISSTVPLKRFVLKKEKGALVDKNPNATFKLGINFDRLLLEYRQR